MPIPGSTPNEFEYDPDFPGLPNYAGTFNISNGMGVDLTDGSQENYRDWHCRTQQRLYDRFADMNDARNLSSDLTNLPGYKLGEYEFVDNWFNVYPKRRRQRRLYPDEITDP